MGREQHDGMASKSLLCRLGIHKWQTHRNDEGQRYITCLRCNKDSDKVTLTDVQGTGF